MSDDSAAPEATARGREAAPSEPALDVSQIKRRPSNERILAIMDGDEPSPGTRRSARPPRVGTPLILGGMLLLVVGMIVLFWALGPRMPIRQPAAGPPPADTNANRP